MLNAYQKAAAKAYAGGEYAHLAEDQWDNVRVELEFLGDGLFKFIMCELADTEDCEDLNEAQRRMERAKDDLDDVITALEELA